MREIAERYDTKRNKILERIHAREVSATLSGIEYYPKPWAELDAANPHELAIIRTNLTWDGARHDPESTSVLARPKAAPEPRS